MSTSARASVSVSRLRLRIAQLPRGAELLAQYDRNGMHIPDTSAEWLLEVIAAAIERGAKDAKRGALT